MKKYLLTLAFVLVSCLSAPAIIWQYGNFDSGKKVCTLTGWSGSQPSSRILKVPESYTHTDGVTYTVNAIASGALDNLTAVIEIHIPASIKSIGLSAGSSIFETSESVENFRNCPALECFVVNTANSVYSSTDDGLLYKTRLKVLLRVPQNIPAAGGVFRVPDNTKYISINAFSENSTISTLYLPRTAEISQNGGFNFMAKLKEFLITGALSSTGLSLSYGALISNGAEVHAFPPASTVRTVTLPASVKLIDKYAFYNAANLEAISLGSVEKISDAAFARSGLKSVSIPTTVTSIGSHAFEACPELTEIHIDAPGTMLYRRFAADSPKLTKVTSAFDIDRIYSSAFINCRSLESFPFSASTDMTLDSIFYGCGFREIVFNSKPVKTTKFGTAIFAGNRNLELIDMSAVSGTEEESFTLGDAFAANCMKLKTVKFPRFASLWRYVNQNTSPAFGYSCTVSKFVLHTIWGLGDGLQANYSTLPGQNHFEPKAYVAVTANSAVDPQNFNSWPVGNLFGATNGATVAPIFICDAYTPSRDYVDPKASYFVPAATTANYHEAADAGCPVRELFKVSFSKSHGKLKVSIDKAEGYDLPAEITHYSVRIDNEHEFTLGTGGYIASVADYSQVEKVRIGYIIDGVQMYTDYPATHWLNTTSADLPSAAHALFTLLQRRLALVGPAESFTLYSIAGTVVAQGSAPAAELSWLPRGTYILRIAGSDISETHKITL